MLTDFNHFITITVTSAASYDWLDWSD